MCIYYKGNPLYRSYTCSKIQSVKKREKMPKNFKKGIDFSVSIVYNKQADEVRDKPGGRVKGRKWDKDERKLRALNFEKASKKLSKKVSKST